VVESAAWKQSQDSFLCPEFGAVSHSASVPNVWALEMSGATIQNSGGFIDRPQTKGDDYGQD